MGAFEAIEEDTDPEWPVPEGGGPPMTATTELFITHLTGSHPTLFIQCGIAIFG